jgi:hypothetical protein
MKKTHRFSFRIEESEARMLTKISGALLTPNNLSETFRLMIQREYTALRHQGLIED